MGYNDISIFENYLGHDLNKKFKKDKFVISTNSNERKMRINNGFGIYTSKYRFIASNLEGFKIFKAKDFEQENEMRDDLLNNKDDILQKVNMFPSIKTILIK